MNDVCMVVSDLDGTLLGKDSVLEEETIEVLSSLKNRNILFVPATSRGFASIASEIIHWSGKYVICSNGAVIYDKELKKNIYEKLMYIKDVLKVMECLQGRDYILSVAQMGKVYTEERLVEMLAHGYPKCDYDKKVKLKDKEALVEQLDKNHGIEKIHINFLDDEERKKSMEILEGVGVWSISSSWHDNIEVTAIGVNKGNAVQYLEGLLNMSSDNIMTIGDGFNDVSMLKDRINGVAMKNASQEVKMFASYVSDYNNMENGFARFIKKKILKPQTD